MTHFKDRVDANVLFLVPTDAGEEWLTSDLWQSATAIPGVTSHADKDGTEASRFHVNTSGHVLIYDSVGQLRYSGGLTAARGHWGDNNSLDTAMQTLSALTSDPLPRDTGRGDANQPPHHTSVFGCSLQDPASACSQESNACLR